MSTLSKEYKYDVKFPCPNFSCNNKKVENWEHSNCGGHYKMNDFGFIKCDICGLERPIKDFRFNCGNCSLKQDTFLDKKYEYGFSLISMVCVMNENKLDSYILHIEDTIKAGAGLSDRKVAEFISKNSAETLL